MKLARRHDVPIQRLSKWCRDRLNATDRVTEGGAGQLHALAGVDTDLPV